VGGTVPRREDTADWPESTESRVGKGNQREAVGDAGLDGCQDSG